MARRRESRLEGPRRKWNPVLDEIRSESGGETITGAAGAQTNIFTIPANRAFHLRNLSIYLSGAAGVVSLYGTTAGGTRTTLFRNALANGAARSISRIQGIMIIASTGQTAQIRASATAGRAWIRVGGILRRRVGGEASNLGDAIPAVV